MILCTVKSNHENVYSNKYLYYDAIVTDNQTQYPKWKEKSTKFVTLISLHFVHTVLCLHTLRDYYQCTYLNIEINYYLIDIEFPVR